jgi:small conductance mechanosensitive channel
MPPSLVPVSSSACSPDNAGSPIHSLCQLVQEHSGAASPWTVALLERLVWPVFVLVVAIVAMRVVRSIAERAIARGGADPQIHALVHNILVAVGVAVAVGAALNAEGLDLNIFLTIGGLSTLAVGLAFQDLLRNILAGILLLLERPFRIGDVVTVGDLTGSVATIQLRTTALRLADGRLAILPNLDAFNKAIINLSAFETRQFTVTVWVPNGADLEAAIRSARTVLDETPEAVAEPPPRIQPAVDIDGGVTLQCQYWLEYRGCDPDAVAASVVRRLQAGLAGEATPPDLVPPRLPDPEPEPASDETAPPGPRRRQRRRLLPGGE